jgi:hypothetical protein
MAEQETTTDKLSAPSLPCEEASKNLRTTGIITGEAGDTDNQRHNSDGKESS